MIEYKRIKIHSHMRNSERPKIEQWLQDNCVFEEFDDDRDRTRWACLTSNYEYSSTGDFDVIFDNNGEAATLFRMSFPESEILEVDQVVTYEVDETHFTSLFEEVA